MKRVIFLDSGPLSMAAHPSAVGVPQACKLWLESQSLAGARIVVPEIADYEVRRELLRVKKLKGIARLDNLKATVGYDRIRTETMLLAAQLWADARSQGRPTANDKALDGDVILAAQALLASSNGTELIVATTNVAHLERFVDARYWDQI